MLYVSVHKTSFYSKNFLQKCYVFKADSEPSKEGLPEAGTEKKHG